MKQKAFTLIELLVVIAIIGVISSIVLVNLSGSREKARIARGQQFGQSIQNALGANAIAVYRFEKLEGGVTPDSSGYDNHCTKSAVGTTNLVEGILGNALNFQYNGYLNCGNNKILDVRKTITIEAWIKYTFTGFINDSVIVDKDSATSYSLRINPEGKIRIWINLHSSQIMDLPYSSKAIPSGQWGHIAVTYDGSAIRYYINGELTDTLVDPSKIYGDIGEQGFGTIVPLCIAADSCGSGGAYKFHNIIDEVRIYDTALITFEIQKHYAEGLERYKDLALKDK